MRKTNLFIVFLILLGLMAFQNCSIAGQPTINGSSQASMSSAQMMEYKAMKVINQKCATCHSGSNAMGGIDYLNDLDSLLYYRMVIPGEAQLSQLYIEIQSG